MWHVSAGYAEGLSCSVALWCWHEGLEALSLQTWNAQTKKDCRQRSQAHMGVCADVLLEQMRDVPRLKHSRSCLLGMLSQLSRFVGTLHARGRLVRD